MRCRCSAIPRAGCRRGRAGGPLGHLPFLAADGVEGVVHPADDAEWVHDPLGVGAPPLDQRLYPSAAVRRHNLDAEPLLAGELVVNAPAYAADGVPLDAARPRHGLHGAVDGHPRHPVLEGPGEARPRTRPRDRFDDGLRQGEGETQYPVHCMAAFS